METPAPEDAWMLATERRLLPLARLLHYARREALELGLARTADSLDQALLALGYPDAAIGGERSAAKH